jgi:hypothetical protein
MIVGVQCIVRFELNRNTSEKKAWNYLVVISVLAMLLVRPSVSIFYNILRFKHQFIKLNFTKCQSFSYVESCFCGGAYSAATNTFL